MLLDDTLPGISEAMNIALPQNFRAAGELNFIFAHREIRTYTSDVGCEGEWSAD